MIYMCVFGEKLLHRSDLNTSAKMSPTVLLYQKFANSAALTRLLLTTAATLTCAAALETAGAAPGAAQQRAGESVSRGRV